MKKKYVVELESRSYDLDGAIPQGPLGVVGYYPTFEEARAAADKYTTSQSVAVISKLTDLEWAIIAHVEKKGGK